MLLLTLFLKLGWIKLQWVQGLSDFLVANLGFFFVPPGVALMLYFDVIAAEFWPIVIATIVSTALVLVVTGWVHQIVRKFRLARQIKLARSLRLSDFHLSDKLHLKNKTNLMNKDKCSFLENNFFLLAVTFGVFFFAKLLQKKTGLVLLNPILLTIAVLIIFLKMANISYETYNQGGHLIEFWLRPAVVALGVPLYLQLEMIKKQLLPILLSQLAGCIVGVISVVLIAKFMGASQEVILSLAPKSVTTPIAMEVTKAIGGIPSLTAAVVVAVGLLGAICGFKTMKIMHVGSPIAQGLSMGTAAHAVGTSTAMDISSKYGAYASLGLTLNGIFTALLTPTILRLLGVL